MTETIQYHAFGLRVQSQFPLPQIPWTTTEERADVVIRREDLTQMQDIPQNGAAVRDREVLLGISEAGRFVIHDGSTILVHPNPACSESLMAVYLMGSCMGAILHQRGILPIHGSCVTDGNQAILITGDSGAGKSTLAAEFIARGWKLMTDDVAALEESPAGMLVQSSYPSQKLWQDAMCRYDRSQSQVHSLYVDRDREKFGVDVSSDFYYGKVPVTLILRLMAAEEPSSIQPITGLCKVDQLLRNTYRLFMVPEAKREQHFRRCVALAEKMPMALLIRQEGVQSAARLYELITNYPGEKDDE